VREALASEVLGRRTRRNRLAEALVHPAVYSLQGLAGARWNAAEATLRAFAFVGLVERYDRSLCLLARTVADHGIVCGACCAKRRLALPLLTSNRSGLHPRVNDGSAHVDAERCRFAPDAEDAELFGRTHPADRQVYEAAVSIFGERWALADAEAWGASPRSCGCQFV